MIYYDLHVHTCLSPCADDDMTPNNILNMAMIKGLDIIAICDHNANYQLDAISKINKPIKVLYGIEIQTIEEVHVLGIFKTYKENDNFYQKIKDKRIKILNNPNYFGNQLIMNEQDKLVGEYEDLLISSINISIEKIIELIHKYNGIAICAHVADRKNGIINQLGFIPDNLLFDAYEVKDINQKEEIIRLYPYLKDKLFLINSDAHKLIDISEAQNSIDEKEFDNLW